MISYGLRFVSLLLYISILLGCAKKDRAWSGIELLQADISFTGKFQKIVLNLEENQLRILLEHNSEFRGKDIYNLNKNLMAWDAGQKLIILEFPSASSTVLGFEDFINKLELEKGSLQFLEKYGKKGIISKRETSFSGGYYIKNLIIMGLKYQTRESLLNTFSFIQKTLNSPF